MKSLAELKAVEIQGNAHGDMALLTGLAGFAADESQSMADRIEALTYLSREVMGLDEAEVGEAEVIEHTKFQREMEG
jgi:UDP-N-acetylglucosamine enolpyruvyl transferase